MNTVWQDLANAIIVQAVDDYRKVKLILKRHPKNENALNEKKRIEKFFISDWYKTLTKVDGVMLLKKIQVEK